MPEAFWVVGGEYTDTTFRHSVLGREEEYGPFPDYGEAKKEWARLAFGTIDDCHVRYRIERRFSD